MEVDSEYYNRSARKESDIVPQRIFARADGQSKGKDFKIVRERPKANTEKKRKLPWILAGIVGITGIALHATKKKMDDLNTGVALLATKKK